MTYATRSLTTDSIQGELSTRNTTSFSNVHIASNSLRKQTLKRTTSITTDTREGKESYCSLRLLAVALIIGRYVLLETVSNDLCSYVSQTEDLRVSASDNTAPAFFPNVTEAPWSCSHRSNRSHPCSTHPVWYGEQLSVQQSPLSSLVIVSPALSVHPNCCNRLPASMSDSLHLQEAQHCLAHRCTQTWLTHDGLKTLANITDTMMTADLLPKVVLQTFSFTGTRGPSNVFAPTTPMQKPAEPHKSTEALQQPHCPEQSAPRLKPPSGKHSLYAHLMSIINVHTFLTSTYTAEALMINDAQCIAHLLCMLVCNMMPLIAASIWLFLTGLGVVAAMHTEMSMARSMHAGFRVHSPPLLTGYTILSSLSSMAMRLALHTVTDIHCALTMVIACIFIAKTHWISACLLALYAPACFEQMLQGLEAALKHTILALIRKPKRHVFAHPQTRYGSYWRRIRNRTRRMRRQMLYKYTKTLCKLLSCVRRLKLQHKHLASLELALQAAIADMQGIELNKAPSFTTAAASRSARIAAANSIKQWAKAQTPAEDIVVQSPEAAQAEEEEDILCILSITNTSGRGLEGGRRVTCAQEASHRQRASKQKPAGNPAPMGHTKSLHNCALQWFTPPTASCKIVASPENQPMYFHSALRHATPDHAAYAASTLTNASRAVVSYTFSMHKTILIRASTTQHRFDIMQHNKMSSIKHVCRTLLTATMGACKLRQHPPHRQTTRAELSPKDPMHYCCRYDAAAPAQMNVYGSELLQICCQLLNDAGLLTWEVQWHCCAENTAHTSLVTTCTCLATFAADNHFLAAGY